MKNPLISIIIPVYNAEAYISRTINSIETQTYDNLEILCINDKSTDSSAALCEALAHQFSNIRLFQNEENMGQEHTRNIGIQNARGEFISFVDSDDTIEPGMIEHLYTVTKQTAADIAISGYTMDHSGLRTYDTASISEGVYSRKDFLSFLYSDIPLGIISCIGNKLYRRALLNENNVYFCKSNQYNEDLAFGIQAVSCCSRIAYTNSVDYIYYIRNSGSTMSSPRPGMFFSISSVHEKIKQVLSDNGLFSEKQAAYADNVFLLVLSSLVNEIRFGTKKSFFLLLDQIRTSSVYTDTASVVYQNPRTPFKYRMILFLLTRKLDPVLYLLFLI